MALSKVPSTRSRGDDGANTMGGSSRLRCRQRPAVLTSAQHRTGHHSALRAVGDHTAKCGNTPGAAVATGAVVDGTAVVTVDELLVGVALAA
jgi:hypothetical protein